MPQPDTIDPRILGQRIAEARKARGKTQEEVADFLECSRPTYIAIEKGDRLAKSEEIVKLASFLGRKVHELVRPTEPVVDLQPHLRAVRREDEGSRRSGPQRGHRRAAAARRGLPGLGEVDERAAALQLSPGSHAEPTDRRRLNWPRAWLCKSGSGSGSATSR